jgi:hypothetical protein
VIATKWKARDRRDGSQTIAGSYAGAAPPGQGSVTPQAGSLPTNDQDKQLGITPQERKAPGVPSNQKQPAGHPALCIQRTVRGSKALAQAAAYCRQSAG